MANFLQRLLNTHFLWIQKKTEVARFERIILADIRQSANFRSTVMEALEFIREHDPRRFARVQRHIHWIVNIGLELGANAEYNSETHTCKIDFMEPKDDADQVWSIFHYACTVIHEATHGALISRGIAYTSEDRARIERLCVCEENRFLARVARLRPDLSEFVAAVQREFDPSAWESSWTASRWQRALSASKHLWR